MWRGVIFLQEESGVSFPNFEISPDFLDHAELQQSRPDDRSHPDRRRPCFHYWHVAAALAVLAATLGFSLAASAQGEPATEGAPSSVQLLQPPGPGQSAAPVVLSLQDALERARKNDAQFLAAVGDVKSAHEDRVQARGAMLPSISDSTQFLNTQGTGVPGIAEGRFVTNDGVHVYRQWAVLHEDLSPNTYLLTGARRAQALESIAKAKAEIARRGLEVAVTKAYYAVVVAQRKYATTQQALDQSKRFFDISQSQERAGQAAHSDVVKAEIQYRQQQQAFDDSRLAEENARLDLAVIIFPVLNENFSVIDDLDLAQPLPVFSEVEALAGKQNPVLQVASATLRQADLDVSAAKAAFLPSFSIDTDYGIEANSLALKSVWATHPEFGRIPTLGYFLTASMTFPVWDWGGLRSKLHQTEIAQEDARTSLSQSQRVMLSNLYSFYNEASVARAEVESARRTAELAVESLRLTNLRYQAGESSALEVVDAQNTLTLARNSYDDSQVRYRVALANLQTLTGNF
jgi:outer membrane protein TolC